MLTATGALFGIIRNTDNNRSIASKVFYGLVVSICTLVKAPAALFLLISHALFFILVNRDWNGRRIRNLMGWVAVGFAINILAVQLLFPEWSQVLMRGIEIGGIRDRRDLAGGFIEYGRDVLNAFLQYWKAYLSLCVAYLSILLAVIRRNPGITNVLVALLVAILSFVLVYSTRHTTFYAILLTTVLLLLVTEVLAQMASGQHPENPYPHALFALLFLLPIGYSWGTNMPIANHSKMASIFPLTFCLLVLFRLHVQQIIHGVAYTLAMIFLCVPPLFVQLIPWFNMDNVYRSHTLLTEQKYDISIGNPVTSLLVDRALREDLTSFKKLFDSSGFLPGWPILDFTGDGVGLVYAVGGKPVGEAWVLGGYPGSEKAQVYLFQFIDVNILRNSWLITSEDNPRHIKEWRKILSDRVGTITHQPAGTVCFRWPYIFRDGKHVGCYKITIWKPSGADDVAR